MIGAGHQAKFQLRAALETHQFEKVIGWNYHPEMLPGLAEVAQDAGVPFEAVSREGMVEADVVISITSVFSPIFGAAHISAGTHVACMGTDTIGKQEAETDLIAKATVFTDEVAQSVTLGEAQHAIAAGLKTRADIHELGAVINGTHAGRTSDDEITLFDGTGVGLQDLAVSARIVEIAKAKGIGMEVDF
jgi:alanine dehydrogenase